MKHTTTMTNNEARQLHRRQVNRLKRELAAMRTAEEVERYWQNHQKTK